MAPVAAVETPFEPSVELLDDHSTAIPGGHRGRGLARSMPGAVVGSILVVGLAFGAALGPGGALGPAGDRNDAKGGTAAAAGNGGGSGAGSYGGTYRGDGDFTKDEFEWEWHGGPDATAKPDVEQPDSTKKPEAEPTKKPDTAPKPTEKPRPDATPKPTEKPDPTKSPSDPIALTLAIKEYHPVLQWGSCDGLGFDYYKVVRSSDSTVTWPAGDGDEVIAAVEQGGTRKAYDKYAPHGDKAWYRVFCVRKGDDGYKVVNASATKGIEVPEEPTPPDPIGIELHAWLTDGGKVALDWSACEVDGFAFYKLVRSDWNEDPSYLPWHDGSEVIAAISEMGATQLETSAPDSGQTAWFRVQCLGYMGDQKVLLGESAAIAVTAP
ncbi:MAG TPA: hypothetical protein VMQ65_09435 [Candidatus Limnocylindria bacterium]|nr:hypothetical protein [Candidatus Limnocylindria bacterium]